TRTASSTPPSTRPTPPPRAPRASAGKASAARASAAATRRTATSKPVRRGPRHRGPLPPRMAMTLPPASAGLGLRRALLDELLAVPAGGFDFLECAPDNWIGVGGRYGEALRTLSARHPLTCHGLSLSLGGVAPLD